MKKNNIQKAHQIFIEHFGSTFLIERDVNQNLLNEYLSYHITKDLEVDWAISEMNRLEQVLISTHNNAVLSESFWKYGLYVGFLKDTSYVYKMLDFLKRRINVLDSETIFRCVGTIINVSTIATKNERQLIIKQCVSVLIELLNEPITISEDYLESDGQQVESVDSLKQKIKRRINYYQKEMI